MESVILQSFSFTLMIAVGIILRKSGFFGKDAGDTVKKILINITLPCAIIVNFSKINSAGVEMLLPVAMGVIVNIIMLAAGALLKRDSAPREQAMFMVSLPSYNIGAFSLPFVQFFLPVAGSVAVCMFDVGNSIMCTGITYAFTAEYIFNSTRKMDWSSVGKRLLSSIPLMTYLAMFLLTLFHIRLPAQLLAMISPVAASNTFMAMFMVGLLFHIELKKEYIKDIVQILACRHIFACFTAVIFYFCLDIDLFIRQALVLATFSPISALAPAYTGMCGGDEGKASAANSISIVMSIVEITVLLVVMGIY